MSQEGAHLEGAHGVHLEPRPSCAATAGLRTNGPAHEAPQEPLLAAASSLQPRLARLHEAQAFGPLGLQTLVATRHAPLVLAASTRLPHGGVGSAVTTEREEESESKASAVTAEHERVGKASPERTTAYRSAYGDPRCRCVCVCVCVCAHSRDDPPRPGSALLLHAGRL